MISYAQAISKLLRSADLAGLFPTELAALAQANGRIAARRILSPEILPRFANSAMDGYALRAHDTAAAPVRLPVAGAIAAGMHPKILKARTACEIMTGAALPAGADAVVPIEAIEKIGGTAVLLRKACRRGDYVRSPGQDFKTGDILIEKGQRISAKHILALAALGVAQVSVRRKPRIAILSTGQELVAPGKNPRPGQIRDASSSYLLAALAEAGCEATSLGIIGDNPQNFRLRIQKALAGHPDLIITTGAVSMGRHDFVTEEVQKLGARLLYHKTAIRPGKPGLAALFAHGPIFFGLPGNPISTVVGLRFFVLPYLRRRLGQPQERPLEARLESIVNKSEGLRCFFKAQVSGKSRVKILPGQGSFQIHSLLKANAWAVLPERNSLLRAGSLIDVFPA